MYARAHMSSTETHAHTSINTRILRFLIARSHERNRTQNIDIHAHTNVDTHTPILTLAHIITFALAVTLLYTYVTLIFALMRALMHTHSRTHTMLPLKTKFAGV